MTPYAELAVASNFSFLRGGRPRLPIWSARRCGFGHAGHRSDRPQTRWPASWRAHDAVKRYPGKKDRRGTGRGGTPALQARGPVCGWSLPTRRRTSSPTRRTVPAGAISCRLLTIGKMKAEKGDCILCLEDLLARAGDLLLIVIARGRARAGRAHAKAASGIGRRLAGRDDAAQGR